MKSLSFWLISFFLASCASSPTSLEQKIYADESARAIVLVWQGNGCPIFRLDYPSIKAISDKYKAKVRFLLINANPQDQLNEIEAEANEFGIDLPILKDGSQNFTLSMGVTRTMEAVILDPKTRTAVYRGPVDDALDYEMSKTAKGHFLDNALSDFLAGKPVRVTNAEVKGCLIGLP